jgi:hypothetical protein
MSYERHDGLGFTAFTALPIAPQPTEEASAPATGVRIPAAMISAAKLLSPTAQVEVPLADRAAYLRWYGNVLGPARYPSVGPGGVVRTTNAVNLRFKGARARITNLAAKGSIRVLTPLRRSFYEFWRNIDKDGQAAWDKVVVSRAPTRDPKFPSLETGPRELVIWFNQQVNAEATQLGLPLESAVRNVVSRGLPEAQRSRLLGFPSAAPAEVAPAPVFGRVPFTVPGPSDEQQAVEDAVIEAMDAAAEVEQEQELPPPSDEIIENGDLEVQQAGMLPFTLPWWGWVGVVGGVVGLSVFGYWYTKKRRPELLGE